MRFASVCSGIGCDRVAWGALGWSCLWHAEIGEDRCPTLTCDHEAPICFQPRVGRNGRGTSIDVAPSLAGANAGATSDMRPCVAFSLASHPLGADELAEPITTRNGDPGCVAIPGAEWAVRRLTPRECERLMGLPDDYTLVPFRGGPAKDTPRYQAIGNAIAVPVLRWIGARIERVEAIVNEEAHA